MLVKLLHAPQIPAYIVGLAATVCRCPEEARRIAEKSDYMNDKLPHLAEACLKSGHMSVFEHISYTFFIDGISRACSHQLVRHRLASYTQASQRHHEATSDSYIRPEGLSPLQVDVWHSAMRMANMSYRRLIDMGVPLEDARSVLPNAASTTIVVTMNARELAHFFELRLCNKAQAEIRELAKRMHELAEAHFPLLFKHIGPPCFMKGECPEAKPCGKTVVVDGNFQKAGQAPESEQGR